MRSREFTINIPINIRINGDGEPVIDMGKGRPSDETPALNQNPVMVPPLQQDIELKKAELGKESPVIDKLIQNSPEVGGEPAPGYPNTRPPVQQQTIPVSNIANKVLQNIPRLSQRPDDALNGELARIKQLIQRK